MQTCVLSLQYPPAIAWMGHATHEAGTADYRLPLMWCLHLYDYAAEWELDGRRHRLQRGSISLTPADTPSRYRWKRQSRHLVMHVAAGSQAPASAFTLPVLLPPASVTTEDRRQLHDAAAVWPNEPARATAIVWQCLWDLATRHGKRIEQSERFHPAVRQAVDFIHQHLAEPIRVEQVVAASDVSHNHLIRLFRQAYGQTIAGYLRSRRCEKARHLLQSSTLPIKVVAVECGVADLQAFNKMIRRATGLSPTALRAGPDAGRQPR